MSTQFDLEVLSVLAAKVDRRLKWAAFLLAAMAGILLIDLQLKRSVAGMAVDAGEQLSLARTLHDAAGRLAAGLKGDDSGGFAPDPVPGGGGDAGRPGPDGVDGVPPVAPAAAGGRRPRARPRGGGPGGPAVRDAGDGPRAEGNPGE